MPCTLSAIAPNRFLSKRRGDFVNKWTSDAMYVQIVTLMPTILMLEVVGVKTKKRGTGKTLECDVFTLPGPGPPVTSTRKAGDLCRYVNGDIWLNLEGGWARWNGVAEEYGRQKHPSSSGYGLNRMDMKWATITALRARRRLKRNRDENRCTDKRRRRRRHTQGKQAEKKAYRQVTYWPKKTANGVIGWQAQAVRSREKKNVFKIISSCVATVSTKEAKKDERGFRSATSRQKQWETEHENIVKNLEKRRE